MCANEQQEKTYLINLRKLLMGKDLIEFIEVLSKSSKLVHIKESDRFNRIVQSCRYRTVEEEEAGKIRTELEQIFISALS